MNYIALRQARDLCLLQQISYRTPLRKKVLYKCCLALSPASKAVVGRVDLVPACHAYVETMERMLVHLECGSRVSWTSYGDQIQDSFALAGPSWFVCSSTCPDLSMVAAGHCPCCKARNRAMAFTGTASRSRLSDMCIGHIDFQDHFSDSCFSGTT
jgi:hypothetical protein